MQHGRPARHQAQMEGQKQVWEYSVSYNRSSEEALSFRHRLQWPVAPSPLQSEALALLLAVTTANLLQLQHVTFLIVLYLGRDCPQQFVVKGKPATYRCSRLHFSQSRANFSHAVLSNKPYPLNLLSTLMHCSQVDSTQIVTSVSKE